MTYYSGMEIEKLIKLKTYRIRANGLRGLQLQLPTSWVEDLGICKGDQLVIYRDFNDRLVIVPKQEASA